jgi:hypothetical protein
MSPARPEPGNTMTVSRKIAVIGGIGAEVSTLALRWANAGRDRIA